MTTYRKTITAVFLMTLLFLTGCGDKAVSEIVDEIKTNRSASISYINGLDTSITFFVQSESYPDSIFRGKHKVADVLSHDESIEIKHQWFDNNNKTKFAIEDTNSKTIKYKTQEHLENKKKYWAVAWFERQNYRLTVFQKSTSNTENKYKVRIFANDKLDVFVNGQTNKLISTEVGKVTNTIEVDSCTDLIIGNNEIDLCQIGMLGDSYLAIVDVNGLIRLIKEE